MHPNVLVVDDEPCVTNGLRRSLQKTSYNIVTAHSGSDALQILAQQPVDILVSDEKMPFMSGTELLTRSSHDYPHTLRVLLTGQANFESAVRAINEGHIHYLLTKPCYGGEFLRTLESAWERREQEKTRLLTTWAQAVYEPSASAGNRPQQESALECLPPLPEEFLGVLSHELRTPLTNLLGYTDLLRAGCFGPVTLEQYYATQKVGTNAHRLRALIDTILAISKVALGQDRIERRVVDVAELMREVANEVRAVWEKGLTFSWHITPGTHYVRTDPVKVKTILKNLVDNAIKFTEQGKVIVDIIPQESGVEIYVTDTGSGIPAEVLPIIFEPFRQGEPLLTRQHEGVGLGLYQVKRLLQMLDGSISVDSTVGHGSTFRVWLPNQSTPVTSVLTRGERIEERVAL